MSSRDEILAQFIEVSGCEESVAEFYLASANWSLEVAMSTYLGSQNEGEDPAPEALASEDPLPSKATPDSGPKPAGASENFEKTSGSRPRFATMTEMTKKNTSDEEEGQAFYAGGSDRSGQQVLGPPKRKNFREQLTDMFRMAQEQNTSETEPVASGSNAGSAWGQGMRLGMTENDHSLVKTPNSEKSGEKKPVVILKLWSEGFSVDDGELRSYDNPENKEFLQTVMRGEIPQELLDIGWMVNVDVEDHRHENYKKKPTSLKTFKGSGHALGSPVPNIEEPKIDSTPSESNPPGSLAAGKNTAGEDLAKSNLNLNTSQPTTTLQIRLADGSRLTGQFNLSHTLGDIHSYIENARPQYAGRSFILVSSFPTRELKDKESTIEKAGLKNAALMQRLV